MLILTRKAGEKLLINDDIEVKILSVSGGHVKLGIDAPKNVTVHREEVYQKLKDKEKSSQ